MEHASSGGAAAGAAVPPPPRLTILKIVMENFKSYGGVKEIGPLHKCFTSVVGAEGCGWVQSSRSTGPPRRAPTSSLLALAQARTVAGSRT